MGTGNAEKVTGLLWSRCSEPHTTENWVWLIHFEREMGAPTCIHRLKAYLTYFITKFSLCDPGLQRMIWMWPLLSVFRNKTDTCLVPIMTKPSWLSNYIFTNFYNIYKLNSVKLLTDHIMFIKAWFILSWKASTIPSMWVWRAADRPKVCTVLQHFSKFYFALSSLDSARKILSNEYKQA